LTNALQISIVMIMLVIIDMIRQAPSVQAAKMVTRLSFDPSSTGGGDVSDGHRLGHSLSP
jgi:hypothetical protein